MYKVIRNFTHSSGIFKEGDVYKGKDIEMLLREKLIAEIVVKKAINKEIVIDKPIVEEKVKKVNKKKK